MNDQRPWQVSNLERRKRRNCNLFSIERMAGLPKTDFRTNSLGSIVKDSLQTTQRTMSLRVLILLSYKTIYRGEITPCITGSGTHLVGILMMAYNYPVILEDSLQHHKIDNPYTYNWLGGLIPYINPTNNPTGVSFHCSLVPTLSKNSKAKRCCSSGFTT